MPRVVAMTVMMPLLTLLANIVGCSGGALISIVEIGVTPSLAFNQMIETVDMIGLFHGLIKATFFGYLVAIIACWVGMSAGGAESVGKSTTNTVVYLVSEHIDGRFHAH